MKETKNEVQNQWRSLVNVYLKLLLVAVCFVVVVAVCSIVYGFIAHRVFTLRYIFEANFLVGVVLIVIGIVLTFLPSAVFTRTGKTTDRFTLVQRSFDSREKRQSKARLVLWFGIFVVLLAGLAEILLSFLT